MNKQEIEKAIKAVKVFKKLKVPVFGLTDHLDVILSSLQEQLTGGWIPVSERLPEERHYPPVICCHTSDHWTDAAIVTDAGAFINGEGCEIYPTHWKPLPEPYKEDAQ